MLNRSLVVFVLLGFVFACSNGTIDLDNNANNEDSKVSTASFDLDWILGEWIDSTKFKGKIIFIESWGKETEQLFTGEKRSIDKGDTLSPTKLSITKTDGKFYYSYTIKGDQITFVQDSISNNFVSFRNTTNVFPDVLIYRLENDTLNISFSGIKSGMKFGSSFKTIKMNNSIK